MKVETQGKIILAIGIVQIMLAIWLEDIYIAFLAGVSVSWSYWFWWREFVLKIRRRKTQ